MNLKTAKMSEIITFKQNRGRPAKYQFPKEPGQIVSIPYQDLRELMAVRMAAYSFSKRKGINIRTWTDQGKINIQVIA